MADEKKKEDAKEDEIQEGASEGEGADAEEAKKKSRLKLIIFIAAPILVLGGVIAGLYFTGIIGGHHDDKKHDEVVKKESNVPKDLAYYNVPDLLINLKASQPGRGSFLKLSVILEVEGQSNIATLNTLKPRIVDQFQVYLRELRVEDLQGSAGIHRLREELLSRVNQITAPLKVRDVLFKDVLVQ